MKLQKKKKTIEVYEVLIYTIFRVRDGWAFLTNFRLIFLGDVIHKQH